MKANIFKGNIFFKDYNDIQLQELYKNNIIEMRSYKKGETVHTAGDACLRMDIVICGTLTAYNLSENGSAISIFNFEENSVIGCNLLFSNNNKYPLNIYCTSDCTIAYIHIENVSYLLSTNHSFTMKFIKAISNYSINLNSKMLTFNHKSLRERILDYLAKERVIQNSNKIKLSLTKKQLADELGVQRPSLFRELKKMREEGFIEYDSNYIVIIDKTCLS